MKIIVTVKRVIDYNVQVRIRPDGEGVEKNNVKMSMNPPDENAVEAALRLKEAGKAEEIIAVSIGEEKSQDTIRTALAMGADRGIHVKTDTETEPLIVAKILKKIIEEEQPDLVIMGKQAIDDDCSQTGQMLAALLGWPQGTFISDLEIEANQATITREIDEGLETIKFNLPAVITCDLRLNDPRYASLPNIMKAKKKPIRQIDLSELGIDTTPRIKQLKISDPPKRSKGIMVKDVAELIHQLKNVEKIL